MQIIEWINLKKLRINIREIIIKGRGGGGI